MCFSLNGRINKMGQRSTNVDGEVTVYSSHFRDRQNKWSLEELESSLTVYYLSFIYKRPTQLVRNLDDTKKKKKV